MPIYEYKCHECNQVFETFVRSISQSSLKVNCETCASGNVEKLVSRFGFSAAGKSTAESKSSPSCSSCTGSSCIGCHS